MAEDLLVRVTSTIRTAERPVELLLSSSLSCGRALVAWAATLGLDDILPSVRLYAGEGRSGPVQLSSPLKALRTPSSAPDAPVTLIAVFDGLYLPPRLLPPRHPGPSNPLAEQAMDVLAPVIQSFAAVSIVDISRLSLVRRSWSRVQDETAIVAMGLHKWLPRTDRVARAAMSVLRAKWPTGAGRARINQPLRYTYTNELRLQSGLTAPVREAVRTSVVHVAGLTLAHVTSSCAAETCVWTEGLYVLRAERDRCHPYLVREVCHLQFGEANARWVNVPEWVSLRRELLSSLPQLSGLRDHQLLLLLFKAADMQRRDSRADQAALYTQICRSFEHLEWLPSYPASDRPHDAPPPPAGPEGEIQLRCEDGTALSAATHKSWTEGLFVVHGVYGALRNFRGMCHLSSTLSLVREFHAAITQSWPYGGLSFGAYCIPFTTKGDGVGPRPAKRMAL